MAISVIMGIHDALVRWVHIDQIAGLSLFQHLAIID